jgi:hypothetical protein
MLTISRFTMVTPNFFVFEKYIYHSAPGARALEKEIGKPSVINHQWLWQIKEAVRTQRKLTPFIHLLSSSTTTIRKECELNNFFMLF